jgi:DNA-binding winged helix-turn-helix (wHTH) protein/tetratricopeptide (TPR) repeat protein
MPTDPEKVRFGPFEVNFTDAELRKHGTRLKIQSKPLSVLQLLVQNQGKIVSREDLQKALWHDDVFVDFEKNLTTAVNKLREALSDTAEEARYIETVPRKGYRFTFPVEVINTFPQNLPQPILPSPATEPLLVQPPPSQDTTQIVIAVPKQSWWRLLAFAALTLALLVAAGALFHRPAVSKPLTEKDTIVLADFENSTGNPVFDDTLKTALGISLRQSPFLNVLSDNQVASTLKLMAGPSGVRLTGDRARDLCIRTGSKAYVAEAIGSLGSEYIVELKAVNCQTGNTLANQQVTAAAQEKVLEALGSAAVQLRTQLGESLATVQKFDVPLEQATTSSLEALKAYSLAQKTARENGAAQSLPYAQRAIELDPNFAMAYAAAGIHYANLAQPERAGVYLTKAFQLRDHASQRERLRISAAYYSSVTGELEKAVQTFQEVIADYPRDVAGYNNLGIVLAEQGEYEKAADITRQGIKVEPSQITLRENLAGYLLALQQFDEVREIVRENQPRKPDNYIFPAALYALAFFASDSTAMAAQEQWFAGRPEYKTFGLELASDTEAFAGHLNKSLALTRQAVNSATESDRKETGAIWLAVAAQREAAFGNIAESRPLAASALKLAPKSEAVELETALAYALSGDRNRAETLAHDVGERYKLDKQTQELWLPTIQAESELNHKDPAAALKTLQAAQPPLEFGVVIFGANAAGSCLYSSYVRGQADLAAGDGKAAAAEFQKILDRPGIVWNCWTGPLARLGKSRANVLESKSLDRVAADAARVRAVSGYKDFLTLWKDADPNIPVLKQAKAEFALLQ